ncbi:hypothetical protein D3C75_1222190 [compost metagenome]
MHQNQQPSGVDRQICEIQDASLAAENQKIRHLMVNDTVNGIAESTAGQESGGCLQYSSTQLSLASVIEYCSDKKHGNDSKILPIALK